MPKYLSTWNEEFTLTVWESDSELAAEVPAELIAELEAARDHLDRIGKQIYEITDAPRQAEIKRRAALTPKQRRDEDLAKSGITARV